MMISIFNVLPRLLRVAFMGVDIPAFHDEDPRWPTGNFSDSYGHLGRTTAFRNASWLASLHENCFESRTHCGEGQVILSRKPLPLGHGRPCFNIELTLYNFSCGLLWQTDYRQMLQQLYKNVWLTTINQYDRQLLISNSNIYTQPL